MLTALDRSDQLLLVSTPDVPSMKNIRLALQTLELLGFPLDRVALVANRRAWPGGALRSRDGPTRSGVTSASCCRGPAVPASINSGVPTVLLRVAQPLLRRRQTLVGTLVAATQPVRREQA
jgi:pilus assembly protein CpaE